MFLDSWVHYQDPTLPKFSALTYLYFAILLLSFAIAADLGKVFDNSQQWKQVQCEKEASEGLRDSEVSGRELMS